MSNLKRTVAEIFKTNPNDDIEAVIRKLRVDILKGMEMSAQEAAWFLLKQHMSHKSRKVVYVPTCYSEEQVHVRKTRAELEALPPGSTDVWKTSLVQNAFIVSHPPEPDLQLQRRLPPFLERSTASTSASATMNEETAFESDFDNSTAMESTVG
ncbi:hypothetical protein MRX96_007722 [Rhipicephalus microplus]